MSLKHRYVDRYRIYTPPTITGTPLQVPLQIHTTKIDTRAIFFVTKVLYLKGFATAKYLPTESIDSDSSAHARPKHPENVRNAQRELVGIQNGDICIIATKTILNIALLIIKLIDNEMIKTCIKLCFCSTGDNATASANEPLNNILR